MVFPIQGMECELMFVQFQLSGFYMSTLNSPTTVGHNVFQPMLISSKKSTCPTLIVFLEN